METRTGGADHGSDRAAEHRTTPGTDWLSSPRTRRRAATAAAVLLTAGIAAGTALLPNPAQAQERPPAAVAHTAHAPAPTGATTDR